jgi:exodeoxyribonuclease VII small subunit
MTTDPLPPALSYADALAELDAILDELEAGDADIDALAGRVERAADLVRLCRDRLDGARTEVTRIVAQLDDHDAGDRPEGAAPS